MRITLNEVEGLDDLLKKIWYLSLKKVLNKSIRKSVFYTEREAKKVTPVDTWLLRNSYETNFEDLEWRLRNFREYWPIVNERTGFFDRTASKVEPQIYRIFEKDLQDFINDLTE